MKTNTKFLTVVATGLFLATAVSSNAQYSAVGADGITASPKLRAQLNEQGASSIAASDTFRPASYWAMGDDGIAASPKLRGMLSAGAVGGTTVARDVTYKTVGDDGVAASPKLRSFLNDNGKTFEIAPVK
ncbi:MAG: hypothetical protein HY300_06270 [Verrucomicrobia bacterium]|nr:hypothetical protein [Verrucomicrobiota bacterium]